MTPAARGGLAALALCLASPAAAQPTLTRLTGRVTDAQTLRGIAGAEVLHIGRDSIGTSTDAAGNWRLDAAGTGPFALRVTHGGYVSRDVSVPRSSVGMTNVALERLPSKLDAIVVTAARREQRLSDAVVETSVIDASLLRRSGAVDLAQVIAEQSGLQLDGGIPAGAGVQMRGFDSRRVLVLLDGAPLVGRVGGNFDLSRLPVSMAERVEIVKGPQSTLYGSDALGGVINIITRKARSEGWSVGISSGAGTQGRLEAGIDALWRRGAIGLTMDGGFRGIDLAPGVASDNGTYARRGNGMATLFWEARPQTQLSASLLGVRESQRYRTGQLFHFANNTQWAARVTGEHRPTPTSRVTASLHGTSFDHLSRASTLGAPVSGDGDRDRQSLVLGEVLWNALIGNVAVDAGTQVRSERIAADRVDGRRREVSGVEPFVQASASLGDLTVVPGMRVSWSDRWGRFLAPRVATMWRLSEPVALRASIGRGYRAPDFKELYLDFVNSAAGYAVRGNEALRPEHSTSVALSGEYSGRILWGRAGVFHNAYRDFIETSEPDAAGTFTYRNLDRGTIRGVELESGVALGSWSADASVDVLHTRDRTTGTVLLGRPRHTARSSVSGPLWTSLRGTASLLYTGRTPIDRDASGTGVLERGGWSRLDLRATQSLPGGLRWSLGVHNVLDRRMGTEWPGFTGRQFVTSLEWRVGSDGGMVGGR